MKSVKLVICNNPHDSETWETIESDDLLESLANRFESFPDNARLYHNHISTMTEVTPVDEKDIEALSELDGVIFCVLWPEGAVAIIAAVIAVVAVAAAFFLAPKLPQVVESKSQKSGSANNSLSDRQNEARPNERIPYIVGKLLATPDLACVPYKTLQGAQEIEHAVMCLGQGSYFIYDAFDDETGFDEISGNSMMVYRPNANVVADTPYYTIGSTFIGQPIYNVKASSSVTGQTLMPANSGDLTGDNNIYFSYPETIDTDDTDLDFTDYFSDNDILVIANSTYFTDPVTGSKNLDGTYTILSVTNSQIILSNPSSVNANWDDLATLPGQKTGNLSPHLTTDSVKWVGPFDLTMKERNKILVNIRANNGLYRVGKNSGNQYKETVTFQIEINQIDNSGNPTGLTQVYNGEISGSATARDAVGVTVDFATSFTGPCRIRIRRTSETNSHSGDQYSDTIKVTELYAVEALYSYSFGDVTILRTRTYSTASALAIKERKTKLLCERELPRRNPDNTFTSELYPTSLASDIFCAVALDKTIGNRQLSELDISNIYNTIDSVRSYFGTDLAAQFCYTFDDNNISFEETATAIADAVFCKAYRRGSSIKLTFEKETNSSVMLFNHRNKLPGSETRTATFGYINDNDGIELDYISPDDDAKVTYYVPADQSAVNPKKLDTVGVRSKVHAHFLAWRAYNKIIYQNITTEFIATHESNLLLLTDRILNSDNTRPIIMEGEVNSVNGLELTLSQPVNFIAGKSYSIFLQLSDATVESIPVSVGSGNKKVILQTAPRLPLVTNSENYAKTVYQIVASDDARQLAFIVSEKEPDTTYTNTIRAINYDSRYYANDKDFINGIISED